MGNYTIFLDVQKSQEGQTSKKFYSKCSENSRSQIVFRTDIFRKLSLGAPDSLQPCFKFLKALDKQRRMNYPFNSVVHALTKDSVFGTRHFLIILCGMQSRASKRREFSPFREMYCFMGIRKVSLKYFNCREMKTNEQTNRQGNICSNLMKVNLIASNCP